ncbi:hypothetical protein FCL47_02900 [Desulfopila sp. IMCC35006]|uniref:thermonuclease family protein n=1 Tax=Desulfopila sp. IMCC35006 TaxID=2569542 RepID=UPI0010ACB8F9|nr:thermonuclease family protein [Desulfopila sp. IMCC35006]TKB28449.1 hypothetical protein FCL47_02900 [Desulfopila sp. IMCC35006]
MKRLLLSFLLVFLLVSISAQAGVITGKVVGIADGDTIAILDSNKIQHKIRLYGIDTPEKGQAFGNAAKKYTASLTAGKTAEVIAYDTDRYGRTVGIVMNNGVNVNQSLIKAGYSSRMTARRADGFFLLPRTSLRFCGVISQNNATLLKSSSFHGYLLRNKNSYFYILLIVSWQCVFSRYQPDKKLSRRFNNG